MRKIRFRYIKENGESTSVTVRCSVKRNASLISEALRHYQRLEHQHVDDSVRVEISRKKLDQHHRRHNQQDQRPLLSEQTVRREKKTQSTAQHQHFPHFDPIQLRRKQCSSTLIDEETPVFCQSDLSCSRLSSSSSSSGFRSHSHSSSESDVPVAHEQEMVHRRTNAIREIYASELKNIRHLKHLVEVNLKHMRLRPDLFSEKQIQFLLGNIEEICRSQQAFFESLKSSIDESQPSQSLIGQCFLLHKEQFKRYADYSVHQPLSSLKLAQLEKSAIYRAFFETCKTTELTFDDILRTPIQCISQYPLQLNELLKWTCPEHPDYPHVQQALKAMRDLTVDITDEKGRTECAGIIHKWQKSVEAWQGENLIETSTQGLGRSDAYLYQYGKKEPVILFLFDHVLIICHRDRRNVLSYVGRADLDHADIDDLPDGKDEQCPSQLLSAWRLYDRLQHRDYLFSHRTAEDKMELMDALEYERAYVGENRSKAFDTPLQTGLARLKTQQYLADQSCSTTISLPPSLHRSISTILQSCSSPSSDAIDQFPVSQRKSSLPRFVRCSSRDSSIDESFRSIRSRFRFWS